MTVTVSQTKDLLLKSWNEFNEDQAPRLGAALAYYTVLSLAPLLILLLAIAGLVLGKEAAQGQLFGQINSMVGPEGAKAIEAMIAGASKPSSGVIASDHRVLDADLRRQFRRGRIEGELERRVGPFR